jgi:hypothetical protein
MIENLTTATPTEIDTAIAALHHSLAKADHKRTSSIGYLHDIAKTRKYRPSTWTNRKSGYDYTATDAEAIAILTDAIEAADAGTYTGPISTYDLKYGSAKKHLEAIPALEAEIAKIKTEINRLEGEWSARPWSRFFLVTSSTGHIHSSMGCSTCRITTTYGWLPEMSGKSEADAMEHLDTIGAGRSTLCSVCFPDAPVGDTRTKVTKAKAAKLAA